MNQKRNTLKKVTGVGTFIALAPSSWTKPLVKSVLLPVHAQTSADITVNFVCESKSDCDSITGKVGGTIVVTMGAGPALVHAAISDGGQIEIDGILLGPISIEFEVHLGVRYAYTIKRKDGTVFAVGFIQGGECKPNCVSAMI